MVSPPLNQNTANASSPAKTKQTNINCCVFGNGCGSQVGGLGGGRLYILKHQNKMRMTNLSYDNAFELNNNQPKLFLQIQQQTHESVLFFQVYTIK
jgi:hypothetical protein